MNKILYDVPGDGCHLIFSKNDKEGLFMYNFSLIDKNRSQLGVPKERKTNYFVTQILKKMNM